MHHYEPLDDDFLSLFRRSSFVKFFNVKVVYCYWDITIVCWSCYWQLYAPPEDCESKLSFFPGIADAISRARKLNESEAQMQIQHEIWKVARAIQRAAAALRGAHFSWQFTICKCNVSWNLLRLLFSSVGCATRCIEIEHIHVNVFLKTSN